MSCVRTISRQAAKNLVSGWLSNEAVFNFSGLFIDAPQSTLVIQAKAPGIVAGFPFIEALAQEMGCQVQWHVQEGAALTTSFTKVASISGPTEEIIHGEQLIKSILSRASGIATFAAKLKKLLKDFSWKGELVSPPNPTPGFALVEEYAMLVAGVPTPRCSSSVLLQCSHLNTPGDLKEAINNLKSKAGKGTQVKVECASLSEAKSAVEAGANVIRFDGLNAKDLSNFSAQIKSMAPTVLIEALANFDETTLRPFALQNVDSLTTRKLCNGYPLLDFKLTYAAFDGLDSTVVTSSLKRAAPASEANELSADTDTINENNGHDMEASKRARNEENINDTTVKVKTETNVGTNSSPAAAAGAATTTEPVNKQKEDTATKLATPTSSTVSTNRGDSTGSSGRGGQTSGNRYNPRNRGYRNQQQQHNRNQQMQRFDGNTPVRQQQGARLSPSRRRGTDNQREISPPRRQSGGALRSGMHQESQLQMAARLLSPGLAMRQGGQSLANSMTLIGGGGGQSSPGNAFRMPLPQRLSGSGQQGQSPNQMMSAQLGGGGFGGMSQQQSFGSSGGGNGGGNSAWPMLSSAAAQGLRLAGLQHPQQQQCRMCGAQNPMNIMFCRNCRSPNR
ncbi:hypothetical protein AAHC03_010315 [Spirometra sp. Aus1]